MGNKGLAKGDVPLYTSPPEPKTKFSEEELRQRLSAEEYRITQEKGTERAGSGELTLSGYRALSTTVHTSLHHTGLPRERFHIISTSRSTSEGDRRRLVYLCGLR